MAVLLNRIVGVPALVEAELDVVVATLAPAVQLLLSSTPEG